MVLDAIMNPLRSVRYWRIEMSERTRTQPVEPVDEVQALADNLAVAFAVWRTLIGSQD